KREIYRGVLRIQLQGDILRGECHAGKKQYHGGNGRQLCTTPLRIFGTFLHGLSGQQVSIPHPRVSPSMARRSGESFPTCRASSLRKTSGCFRKTPRVRR